MAKLTIDTDKYGDTSPSPVVEAFHSAIHDLVRSRFAAAGGGWTDFVFDTANTTITAKDFEQIERQLLEAGHRFDWSAAISPSERPDAYKPAAGTSESDLAAFSFEHPDAVVGEAEDDGREQRGIGDNVVKYTETTVGIARHIRSSERVLKWLTDGVPPNTIAVIDDSGGTLTAPILEQFTGVVCAGGTVRSHLGILTREYGIPCLMNAKVAGIKEGDRIEIESTAKAKTAEDYQSGKAATAKVWRIAPTKGDK